MASVAGNLPSIRAGAKPDVGDYPKKRCANLDEAHRFCAIFCFQREVARFRKDIGQRGTNQRFVVYKQQDRKIVQ